MNYDNSPNDTLIIRGKIFLTMTNLHGIFFGSSHDLIVFPLHLKLALSNNIMLINFTQNIQIDKNVIPI